MVPASAFSAHGRAQIEFTMVGGGASPAVCTNGEDASLWCASNAHAATGIYTFVLTCAGSVLLKARIGVRSTAAKLFPVHQWDGATKTLTVRFYNDAGTLTALSTDEIAEFDLVFKDSF